ncbi:GMC oxidoreductase [Rothia kristinae]
MPLHDRRAVPRAALTGGTLATGAVALTSPASAAERTDAARAAEQRAGRRVAVIGSGYGGAVAADRLTRRGIPVDLIEMGVDWDSFPKDGGRTFTSMTKPTSRSVWFETRTDMPFSTLGGFDLINRDVAAGAGVLGIERFEQMKVYVGRGVGGGSLVNGGMAVTPDRAFFEQVLPQVDAAQMYSRYFPEANRALGVQAPATDLVGTAAYYQFARVAASHAAKAGYRTVPVPNVYDWDHMRREGHRRAERSALAQEVIYGNNHGKKSLTRTLLKKALDTGLVNLTSLTEVTGITRQEDGAYRLELKTIDFSGNVLSRSTRVYDRAILAAGSVGTARLLMKAQHDGGVAGLRGNDGIGAGWGPNGNTMLARWLGFGTRTGSLQSTIPALGIRAWDGSQNSVFAEIAPFPAGLETHSNVYLAITNNPNLARFGWDPARGLSLGWTQQMSQPSVAAVRAVFDRINAANPGTRYRGDLFEGGKQFTDYFTYHPLGGAVLGQATDEQGEVRGAPGLFVMDGSLIPGKIGVNPFVTITALAMRSMDRLLEAGRFS